MPSGAKIAKFSNQTQELVVCAIRRDDVPAVSRLTRIYASGQVLPDEPDEYLNTVTVLGKEWHCFDGVKNPNKLRDTGEHGVSAR